MSGKPEQLNSGAQSPPAGERETKDPMGEPPPQNEPSVVSSSPNADLLYVWPRTDKKQTGVTDEAVKVSVDGPNIGLTVQAGEKA